MISLEKQVSQRLQSDRHLDVLRVSQEQRRTLDIEKEKLLKEAKAWSPDQNVNWSQLAREYGITLPNGGQLMKEENNIPSASIQQRRLRKPRRCKKRVKSTNITHPHVSN